MTGLTFLKKLENFSLILIFPFARFHGTEPFARTLSGSVFAFQLADRLRSGTCLASALLSLMLCSRSARTLYDLFLASYLKVPRAKALHFLA